MNRLEQLNTIYDFLRSRGIVHTKLEFAKKLGIDKSTMYMAFAGREKFLSDNLFYNRIPSAFPDVFNREWLQKGFGLMTNEPIVPHNKMENVSGVGIQASGNATVTMPQSDFQLHLENKVLKEQIEMLRAENERLWAIINDRLNK